MEFCVPERRVDLMNEPYHDTYKSRFSSQSSNQSIKPFIGLRRLDSMKACFLKCWSGVPQTCCVYFQDWNTGQRSTVTTTYIEPCASNSTLHLIRAATYSASSPIITNLRIYKNLCCHFQLTAVKAGAKIWLLLNHSPAHGRVTSLLQP